MKTRTGYVSNSSSSSFCIVGVVADSYNLAEQFDGYDEEKYGGAYDFLEEKCNGDLYFEHGLGDYSEEQWIVGMSIENMQDDQTLGDFKKAVFDRLKEAGWKGDDPNEVEIHIDGGYSG